MAHTLPDILRCDWPAEMPEPPPPTGQAIERAAAILRRGGLVAFPTETVYGLAANALDADAVAGIFRAKGRPATNPLIVHVSDAAMARSLAGSWPAAAQAIVARLWPGPVTVVVPRGPRIPDVVTAGGSTVALRCPDHRLARRLIEVAGVPLAAPSANRSEAVSPTTAQHVLEGLGDRVDLILDGGRCGRGIESTVVDCTTDPPCILRPGPLTGTALAAVVGGLVEAVSASSAAPARSPGRQPRHYAPRTPLELCRDPVHRLTELLDAGRRVAFLGTRPEDAAIRALATHRDLLVVPMPTDPEAYAQRLYATLHAIDQRACDLIVVEPPPDEETWQAVRDRLVRAAT